MTAPLHTPTPWFVCRDDSDPKNDASLFIQSDTAIIARMDRRGDGCSSYIKRTKADADFLVHCVNTHAALLAALEASVAAQEANEAWLTYLGQFAEKRHKPDELAAAEAEEERLRAVSEAAYENFATLRAAALSAAKPEPQKK